VPEGCVKRRRGCMTHLLFSTYVRITYVTCSHLVKFQLEFELSITVQVHTNVFVLRNKNHVTLRSIEDLQCFVKPFLLLWNQQSFLSLCPHCRESSLVLLSNHATFQCLSSPVANKTTSCGGPAPPRREEETL